MFHYPDELIKNVLRSTRTVAVVGISANESRPSNEVASFMQSLGYRIIPVNPGLAGQTLLGERVYPDLKSIPDPVDMVDVFRNSDAAGAVADEAVAIGAKVVWMQLGVVDEAAAKRAEKAGLTVIMDRCPKIEFAKFGREIAPVGRDPRITDNRK